MSKFVWGTVVSTSPLTLRLDTDTTARPFPPDSMVDPLSLVADDRVWCTFAGHKLIVVGRSRGTREFAIGEFRDGLWTADTVPVGTLPADGSLHLIAEWPKLAALFVTVLGSANVFGGDGTATFGMPDLRERVRVNKGEAGIFSLLGDTTGAKTHTHPLSDSGQAKVATGGSGMFVKEVSTPSWVANWRVNGTQAASSQDRATGAGLAGATDSGSSVQPSFVVRVAIQAA